MKYLALILISIMSFCWSVDTSLAKEKDIVIKVTDDFVTYNHNTLLCATDSACVSPEDIKNFKAGEDFNNRSVDIKTKKLTQNEEIPELFFKDADSHCQNSRKKVYEAFCNVFGDEMSQQTIGENSSLGGVINHFAKNIENMVLNMQSASQDKCDNCLEKSYNEVAGAGNFRADKKEITEIVNKELEVSALTGQLYKLSDKMEKALRLSSIYSRSIDKILAGNENAQQIKDQLACKDSKSISQKIKSKCGEKEAVALEKLKLAAQRMNIDSSASGSIEGIISKLQDITSSVETKRTCAAGKLNLSDYQRGKFVDNELNLKNYSERTPSSQSYKFIESMVFNNDFMKNYCANTDNPPVKDPLSFFKYKVLGMIDGKEVITSEGEKQNINSALSNYFANVKAIITETDQKVKNEVDVDKIREIKTLQNMYLDVDGTIDEFDPEQKKLLIYRIFRGNTIDSDPNLKAMLTDWGALCEVAKDGQSSGKGLEDFVRGDHIQEKDSQDMHQHHFDKIQAYAKSACEKTYDDIADFACLGYEPKEPEVESEYRDYLGNYSQDDIDEAKKKVFNQFDNGSDRDRKKQMALGAASCGTLYSLNPEDSTKQPFVHTSSLYKRNHAHDDKEIDDHYYSHGVLADGFNSAIGNEDYAKMYCDSSKLSFMQSLVENDIYGIEIPESDILNVIKSNRSEYDGRPDFVDYYESKTGRTLRGGVSKRYGRRGVAGRGGAVTGGEIPDSVFGSSSSGKTEGQKAFESLQSLNEQSNQISNYVQQNGVDNTAVQEMKKLTNDVVASAPKTLAESSDKASNDQKYEELLSKLMKQNEDLKKQLQNKVDNGTASATDRSNLSELESQIEDLKAAKNAILAKKSREKNQKEKLGSEKINTPKASELKADSGNVESRLASDFASVSNGSVAGQRGLASASLSELQYRNGTTGLVLTENPQDAAVAIRLRELTAADIEAGGIDVINGANGPRLIKIPGHTHYMEVEDLRKFLAEEGTPELKALFAEILEKPDQVANFTDEEDEVLLIKDVGEDITSLQALRAQLKDMNLTQGK